MKKILLVFMMISLWAVSSWAVTVQVGSGTATVAYVPVYSYYGYSYSQQIYLGSEITAGGGSAGTVTKIRFYFSSGTWNVNSSGWTIYLGNTTKTSFAGTTDWVPVGSMAQVFSGTISTPVAGTWLEITLNPTFNYTGDNLVVAVDENVSGYTGSPCYWRSFSPVGNRAIYACSDTQNPDPASPPNGTLSTGINQVQFEMTLTTPYLNVVPASIAFNYIPSGGTSASQYVLSGDNLTTGPIVVNAPASFGLSLTAGGPYSSFVNVSYTLPTLGNIPIYVQFAPTGPAANYSDNITNVGGGASINVAVTGTSIFSVCDAGATFCDEFISKVQVGTINNISACTAGGYANYTTISTNMNKGVGYVITVTDGPPNYFSDQCGIWVDWNHDGDFVDGGETINVSGTPGFGPYTATITPPVGAVETSTRLRIRILYTGTVNPCGTTDWGEVEDYTINVLPATSCPPPSAQTATNFSTSGADLGWTSAESFFDLYIVPTGSPAPTAGSVPTVNDNPGNSFTWTGGTASTIYDWYVRADCAAGGGTGQSDWTGPHTFTTLCIAFSIPFSESFPTSSWPTCWAQTSTLTPRWNVNNTNTAGGTAYEMRATYVNGTGTSRLITPAINLGSASNPYLIFKQMFDDYGAGVTIGVQTSINDGASWVTEWSYSGGSGSILPETKAIPLTNYGANTLIAWWINGDHYQFNFWYVDDVVVQDGAPFYPGIWKGTVDTDWNNTGNWDDGIVPTAAVNVTIPTGCPNYPIVIAPAVCNNLTIGAGGTLDISGGTLTAAGNLYVSAATGNFNMSSGTLNVASIFQSAPYTWSNGTFTLSGGTINLTGTAFFYGGSGSTMSGTFVFNVGGTLQIDNAMWTMTGGTINLLGTAANPSYFLPPTGTATALAYNLNVNSGAATYIFSRDANINNDVIVNNFTIQSGFANLYSAPLETGNPGTFTVGGDLTVAANNNASLTIPAVTTFTVTGNTNQSLKSVTGYGSIIGYINGQYNFNVEIEGLAAGRWILISPPVPGLTAAMFGCQYLQKHDPILNTWSDMTPPDPLVPGVDYALWVHPDALTSVAPCAVIPPLTSFTWTGIMNTGPVVVPLLCDDPINEGWNNVGNPYQSTIDWNSLLPFSTTNVNDAIYIENNGLWASYVAGVGINGGTQFIAPGQGFFVQCNSIAGGSIGFSDFACTHTRAPFFKTDVANMVRLQASGNNRTDETVIRFTDEAIAGFDGNFDARKFFTSVMDYPDIPQIYSTANGNLSINSLPATEMVAVGFKAGIAGDYTISATESSDFTNLVLEDLQTSTFTNLLNKSYTFSYELGSNDGRFILHFSPLAIAENQSSPVKIYASQKDVYISVPANTHGNFMVFNLMGQEVAKATIDNMLNKKSIGESGIYIVKVIIEGQVFTQKVIIQ